MRNNVFTALIVFATIAALCGLNSGFAQPGPRVAAKWEYKVVNLGVHGGAETDWTTKLNRFGDEGWEVIDTSTSTQRGDSYGCHAIMKRPK